MARHRFSPVAAFGLAFVAALAVGGCATGPTIRTDFDQTADFSRFRTFSWVFTAPPQNMNPMLFQRVRDSIDRTLQQRFTPATPGDFAIAFTLGRRDTVQITDLGPYGPFFHRWDRGWGSRPGWRSAGQRRVDVRNVTDGTLVIDIYDTATRRPVWHGIATQQISPSRPPSQAQIDAAIAEVLSRFPPNTDGS